MKGAFIKAHRTKATLEERVTLIRKYLVGEMSAVDIYQTVRISDQSFRDRIRVYKQDESFGLINDDNNRKYSRELKTNVVEAYLAGEGSQSEICARYKIRSRSQLQKWIKLYDSGKNLKEITGGSRMSKSLKTTL